MISGNFPWNIARSSDYFYKKITKPAQFFEVHERKSGKKHFSDELKDLLIKLWS